MSIFIEYYLYFKRVYVYVDMFITNRSERKKIGFQYALPRLLSRSDSHQWAHSYQSRDPFTLSHIRHILLHVLSYIILIFSLYPRRIVRANFFKRRIIDNFFPKQQPPLYNVSPPKRSTFIPVHLHRGQ